MSVRIIYRNQCARKVVELFPEFEINFFEARNECGKSPLNTSTFHALAGPSATTLQAVDAFARLFADKPPVLKSSQPEQNDVDAVENESDNGVISFFIGAFNFIENEIFPS